MIMIINNIIKFLLTYGDDIYNYFKYNLIIKLK